MISWLCHPLFYILTFKGQFSLKSLPSELPWVLASEGISGLPVLGLAL
jgi:hypothetical protein